MRAVATLLLLACPCLVDGQETDQRLPLPENKAIENARTAILGIIGQDIMKAKTNKARKDLAERILKMAKDSKESPANRWVLFIEARDLAIATGDVALANQTTTDLIMAFQADRARNMVDVAERLSKTASANASKAFTDLIQTEAELASDADDDESAVRLFTIGIQFTKKGKDSNTTQKLELRLQQAKECAKAYDDVKGIDEHMGKFQCFRKGNWKKGLPLLVNAQDKGLVDVVNKDLANPKEAKDQVDLGDAWFELGSNAKGEDRLGMMRRAFHWLVAGMDGASGFAKAKIESRIGKIIAEVDEADSKDGRFTLLAGQWRIDWNHNIKWEITISALGRVDLEREILPDRSVIERHILCNGYMARKVGNVSAKKAEAFNVGTPNVVDIYRLSGAGVAIDRYQPVTDFPKKVHVFGKLMPMR